MVLNDLMENERSIVSFMDSASYGITDILDAISSAIMKEIVTVHPLKNINFPKSNISHAFKYTDEGYVVFGKP